MNILKKPLITEKANAGNENGVYVFLVDKKANKISIKQEVEKTYGVTVEAVRTAILPGKPKARYAKGRFIQGRTSLYKKAYVQLAGDDIIDFFDDDQQGAE